MGPKLAEHRAVRPPLNWRVRALLIPGMTSSPLELPDYPGARHLGDLSRGETSWRVFLETPQEGPPVRGRVHFVSSDTTRSTGWIFVEPSEQELLRRFQDFSPVELWKLLESLG